MSRMFRMLATAARRPRTKVDDGHDRTAAAAPDGTASTSATAATSTRCRTVSDRIRCWRARRRRRAMVRPLIRRSLSRAVRQRADRRRSRSHLARRISGGSGPVSRRQREVKGAAASRRGLRPDAPALGLDDPPAGREADPAAVVLAAAAREHLEDRAVLGQSDPVVAYREVPAGLAVFRRHGDVRGSAVVKLEGVGDEVLKDPDQPGAAYLQRGKRADLDAPVDVFDLRRQCGEDLGHDLAAVDLGAACAVAGGGRVLKDAVDQTGSSLHALVEKPDHLVLLDAEPGATPEQVRHDAHADEWLAEVVRGNRG